MKEADVFLAGIAIIAIVAGFFFHLGWDAWRKP